MTARPKGRGAGSPAGARSMERRSADSLHKKLHHPAERSPKPPRVIPSKVPPPTPQGLLALYRPDVSKTLDLMQAPSYRQAQVFEHLLRRPLQPFSRATALPGTERQVLDELGASTLDVAASRTAADGTSKLLLRARDGACIETVIMGYRERVTVCLSSQVGCPVACAFCATGGLGLHRNLTVSEIVDQARIASALAAEDARRVSNLVYMGMGEPLLNLQAVLDSIRILTDPRGMGLSHRAISVSTIGIPGGIVRLGRAEPQVNLALSLHAADDATRALLVPKRFSHPVAELLEAAWEHFAITHRKLLIEYVLLCSVNDSPDDARRLAGLLRGHVVTVNLLQWNPVSQRGLPTSESLQAPLRPSLPATVAAFRETLLNAHVEAVVRRSKGADIHAACGQLAGRANAYARPADL